MSAPECLVNLANFTECFGNGGTCVVRNETFSTCRCPNGRIGATCNALRVPLQGVYIFDGIIYFLVLVFWIFLARRRYRKVKGADFDAAKLKGVLTSHPNVFGARALWLYRFVVFVFVFGVHMSELKHAPDVYKFYTVWNFITVILYFALGLGLSTMYLWKGAEGITQSRYWRFNAALHYLLLEIELPNALIVDTVVWAILFPPCAPKCFLEFSSIIQHLINFPLMLGDFILCRHAFDRHHYPFNLAMPTSFAIFHLFFTIANDRFGHQPVYFFMDASTAFQPLWIFGVLFIHLGIFFLLWAISTYIIGRSLDQVFDTGSDQKPLILNADNPEFRDGVSKDSGAAKLDNAGPEQQKTTDRSSVPKTVDV